MNDELQAEYDQMKQEHYDARRDEVEGIGGAQHYE